MTRAQYFALCIIGAVAGLAYLQSYEVARYLKGRGVDLSKQPGTTV